jgi:hypothetical protein
MAYASGGFEEALYCPLAQLKHGGDFPGALTLLPQFSYPFGSGAHPQLLPAPWLLLDATRQGTAKAG